MATMVKRELDVPINKTVFWTDSTAVLKYVTNFSIKKQWSTISNSNAFENGQSVTLKLEKFDNEHVVRQEGFS